MFEFDDQYTDFQRPEILHCMWRQWLHPLHTGNCGRLSCLAAVKENLALRASPNEMTPALKVSNSAPAVGVQRNDITRQDRSAQHANAVVFQQDRVMFRRGDNGIE